MYKIEVELKNNKWFGTFHPYRSTPFSLELAYLSIILPKNIVEDIQARNPGTRVTLIESSKIS